MKKYCYLMKANRPIKGSSYNEWKFFHLSYNIVVREKEYNLDIGFRVTK